MEFNIDIKYIKIQIYIAYIAEIMIFQSPNIVKCSIKILILLLTPCKWNANFGFKQVQKYTLSLINFENR